MAERIFELRKFKKELVADEWRATFVGKADFIGLTEVKVSVPASEEDGEHRKADRSADDCLLRAKRRATLGLLILADTALAALPKEEQDFILKTLQGLKSGTQTAADAPTDATRPSAE